MNLKDYAKGAGDLVNLFPEKLSLKTNTANTAEERIAAAWNKVGDSFRKAISDNKIHVKK